MPTPNSLALVRQSDGRVVTFVRADLPAGYTPPEGYTLVPDDHLPVGWQMEPVSAEPRSQKTDIVLSRLTDAEYDALTTSAVIGIRRAVDMARSTGTISDAHPAFAPFVAGADALGLIAADRWANLLAP